VKGAGVTAMGIDPYGPPRPGPIIWLGGPTTTVYEDNL